MSRALRAGLLAAACAGLACAPLAHLRDKLGFVSNAPTRPTPTPLPGSGSFEDYLLEAFPEARTVRIDPQSPKLSLAAESVITRDDPHMRRGPPRFSPDGRLVAYEETTREGGDRWLVIRKLNGVVIRRIELTAPGVSHAPRKASDEALGHAPITWAPSSDAFAYTHETALGAWEILVSDLAGSAHRGNGPPAVPGTLAWSPDADRIAYVPATRTSEIWVLDVTSRSSALLATAPAEIQSICWSSDSRRLVLAAGWEQRDIYLYDVAHQTFTPVTRWSFDDIAPSFSPDGRYIAFYTSFRPLGAPPGWALAVVAGDGSDPPAGAALIDHVIAATAEVHDDTPPPAWSPDGRWLAFIEPQSDEYHALVLIEPVRGKRDELAPDSVTNEDITVSSDGVLAYRARKEWGDHVVLGLSARGASRVER